MYSRKLYTAVLQTARAMLLLYPQLSEREGGFKRMDAKKTGKLISVLRKEKGMTQGELAQELFVSDKTVSKWESGGGYPEIATLLQLSEILRVSVDFLLNCDEINENNIAIAHEMYEFKGYTSGDHISDEKALTESFVQTGKIEERLYVEYDVKKGLRDINGNGVRAGLTDISKVVGKKDINGEKRPCEGELYYRGYSIQDLVNGHDHSNNFGFEEVTYLLLTGKLPNSRELEDFCDILSQKRVLPLNFIKDVIMKAPSADIMTSMSKSILALASYDSKANDTSLENVMRQSLKLIAVMPVLAVSAYQSYEYYRNNKSLTLHHPRPDYSTAENILHMLRPDKRFTQTEARVLDAVLMLHAEHGGGNNSTFTTHVVTSSGADTYAAITAAMCSLKGPKHGGANLRVVEMFKDIKKNVSDTQNKNELEAYINKILNKEAFDRSGLVYGIGHAVYSLSDPRAEIMREYARQLSAEKGLDSEFELYSNVEEIAVRCIMEKRKIYKGVSVNVDFYSGLAYSMLGIPEEIYTPLFAIARISGWSAHRLEELLNAGKIIRPEYKSVMVEKEYKSIDLR